MKAHRHPNLCVMAAGFFIQREHEWLGASPDNWVIDPDNESGNTGLAEYKCPYAAREMTPQEAVEKKLGPFCLEKSDGSFRLKMKHKYFHQVQGQMAVTGMPWCDFVVWTPHGLHVERIFFDKAVWDQRMFPKLQKFFDDAMLPELVAPRYSQGQPIREPWTDTV